MSTRRAFTLLELSAVLLLVAALSTLVAVSLKGSLAAARVRDPADQIAKFDSQARLIARSFPRDVELRLDGGTLVRRINTGGTAEDHPLQISSGFRVDALRPAGAGPIHLSASGTTPDYAVHLAGPRRSTWVIFSGLTGASVSTDHEEEINAIFPTR